MTLPKQSKTPSFSSCQAFILTVSVLGLTLLACGVMTNKTPAIEPAQVSPTTATLVQSESVPSGEGGDLIAFIRVGDICVMGPDGSNVRCLTDDGRTHLGSLTWSPDGSQIAFVSDRDGDGCEIYVMGVDEGDVRRLTHENHCNSSPAWSPDGSRIAFVSDLDGGNNNIYVMEVDGSNLQRLTEESYWNGYPTWSPDGSQIAFVSVRVANTHEICVMGAADGSNLHCLTSSSTMQKDLAWSPDGSRIAFVSGQNGHDDVYVIEVEGGNVRRLTDDSAVDSSPTWSPDGVQIAFASQSEGDESIYVMEADGSNARPLTDNSDWEMSPAWRPDGDKVVVVAANVKVPDSTSPTAITTTPTPTIPISEAQPLRVTEQWFARTQPDGLSYAFMVENPNQNLALENARYQVTAYDEAGTVLGTYSHIIPVVFPAQRLGVASRIHLLEEAEVAKLDIQINPGESKASELTGGPFTTEQVTFTRDPIYPKVTGIVKSSLEKDVTHLAVTAIIYDESGVIIGGGDEILNFVLANGQAAASVNVEMTAEPAKVELYPRFHEYSKLNDVSAQRQSLTVEAVGACRDLTGGVRFAFIVKNSDKTMTFLNTAYQATAYDKAGNVLGTRSGSIPVVFPNEQLGVANTLLASRQTSVDRLEVQLSPQKTIVSELIGNPFTVEQVEYIPDQIFPQVTGIVKSSWGKEVGVTFTAIAYDESGAIIGGGFANGVAEANGQGVISVNVDLAEQQPANVELYPAFQTHADFYFPQ
jgi:Tol biopolymer transport system component